MSVSRCMREIDSAEFAEWMAFSMYEPFGPEREDQRAGMVAALIANVNRDSSKKSDPYTVEDFFPRYETLMEQVRSYSQPIDLESKIMSWAATMNAAHEAQTASKGRGKKSELRPKKG